LICFVYLSFYNTTSTAASLAEFIMRFGASNQSTVIELVDLAVGAISYGLSPEEYDDVRSRVVRAVVACASSRPRSRIDASSAFDFDFLLAPSCTSNSYNDTDVLLANETIEIDSIRISDKLATATTSAVADIGDVQQGLSQELKSKINHFNASRTTRRTAKFTLISSSTPLIATTTTTSNSTQKRWKRRT